MFSLKCLRDVQEEVLSEVAGNMAQEEDEVSGIATRATRLAWKSAGPALNLSSTLVSSVPTGSLTSPPLNWWARTHLI